MSLADLVNEGFDDCVYINDKGFEMKLKLKAYRRIAGGFQETVANAAYLNKPKGFKPRRIHFHHAATNRRTTVPWALPDAQYFNQSLEISIDGVANWKATGRAGEELTFP